MKSEVETIYNQKYLKYKAKYFELKTLKNSVDNETCSHCGLANKSCSLKTNYNMSGGSKDKKKLFLFKADWCMHCKIFAPTWNSLQNNIKDNVKFITYDSEKNANKIKAFKISGFPTLILQVNDKAIEYVGPRDEQSLKDFINKY